MSEIESNVAYLGNMRARRELETLLHAFDNFLHDVGPDEPWVIVEAAAAEGAIAALKAGDSSKAREFLTRNLHVMAEDLQRTSDPDRKKGLKEKIAQFEQLLANLQ